MTRKEFMAIIDKKAVPGGLWLLHGTDRYTIRKAVSGCREIPDEAARELNVSELEAPSLPDVWSAADALPFFSEMRVVAVEKLDLDSMRALAEQKKRVPDSTILLIIRYDKAKKEWTELFDAERIVEFTPYNEPELSDFFDNLAKENGLKIEAAAKRELLARCGEDYKNNNKQSWADLAQVESCVKLLATARTDNKPVTLQQVETYVPPVVDEKAWFIMDDFLSGNLRHGIASFEAMYKDDPGSVFLTLGYMVKRCGQMIEAKRLLAYKVSEAQIATALGLKPGSGASGVIRACRKPSHKQLARILRALCRFDSDLRRGAMSDHDAFFLALCRAFIDETEEDANA